MSSGSAEDFRTRLTTIERALDNDAYVPGPWQRLIADLRQAPPPVRAALADEVSGVNRKLHLRRKRVTVSLTAGLCIESFAALLGGILLTLGIVNRSNLLAIAAMILWVSSFEPLVKLIVGTTLGITYDYAYLFGGIEPRFKTDFGSYLAAPTWSRVVFHFSGTLGSPLGAILVAPISGEQLQVARFASWAVFWIVIAINGAAFIAGLAGIHRVRGLRIADTSGGMAGVELRSTFRLPQ